MSGFTGWVVPSSLALCRNSSLRWEVASLDSGSLHQTDGMGRRLSSALSGKDPGPGWLLSESQSKPCMKAGTHTWPCPVLGCVPGIGPGSQKSLNEHLGWLGGRWRGSPEDAV